ncbi:hypothetical protein Ciccas_000230 [Cichlidogyrus casuarinus]|uniref:Granulins domain-containing protein n=1 Tax=Cichlidogyrus casuarinus TaxID=1844966 RepID=A0ABD2QNP0_9PLAT
MRCVHRNQTFAKAEKDFGTPWCPGHKIRCQPHYTCCTTDEKRTTCCPLPNGVCCRGAATCCPIGQTCSQDGMKCFTNGTNSFSEKILGLFNKETSSFISELAENPMERVTCEGGDSFCPSGSSCCQSKNKITGNACCPYKNAVCCSDGDSCCPENSQCDVESGVCKTGNAVRALMLLTRVSYTKELTTSDNELCDTCHQQGGICCSDKQECYKENFPAKCCAHGTGACPEGFECFENHCVNAFGISIPKLSKVMRYEDLLERSWTINSHDQGFEFPVRPNLKAFRDKRLS